MIGWLEQNLAELRIVAIGHRVVHGGLDFVKPVLIDDDVIGKQLRHNKPLNILCTASNMKSVP